MRTKLIFVTGGVMSGLGKGVTTSSIAKLLQLTNQRVSCVKIDPYLNYDAGTMSPVAHGEVFVTADGGECDMDIGNYERFLDQNMPKSHNITTAQVYSSVITAEREGRYLGACVQIIPHITDEIKSRIRAISEEEGLDILVVECGGTVGDIESLPFLEAFRQIRVEESKENTLFVHVTLAPSLDVVGEQKTKPTQYSVQELRRIGIQPDILAVRCSKPLVEQARDKIALFTNVDRTDVLSCHDVDSVFEVPKVLHEQGLADSIFRKFGRVGLVDASSRWDAWSDTVSRITASGLPETRIAMVGKYVTLADSYVSVNHALVHAGVDMGVRVRIGWIDSEKVNVADLTKYGGILAPGGFGTRGSQGIIDAATLALEADVPYLGICFGFQLAAVAFGRHACGYEDANSTEIARTAHPVVDLLPEQKDVQDMGGSLRLGAYDVRVRDGSNAAAMYRSSTISKRHRHRYEINSDYVGEFAAKGLEFTGDSDGGRRMEILEVADRRFFVGVQYHPEFDSRPARPEPVFRSFVAASSGKP